MALGSTRNSSNVDQITKMFGNVIKWQNAIPVLNLLSQNPITKKKTLQYLNNNINKLYSIYGNGFQMERVIEIYHNCIVTQEDYETVIEICQKGDFYKIMKNICLRYSEIAHALLNVN